MDEQSTKGPGSIQQKGLKEIAYDDWIVVILHTLFNYSCYLNFGIQCGRCSLWTVQTLKSSYLENVLFHLSKKPFYHAN